MEWGWRRFYSKIEFGVKNGVGLEMPLNGILWVGQFTLVIVFIYLRGFLSPN